jgi:methanogenic corrinoid protein MtbC1
MDREERRKELLKQLHDGVVELDEEKVVEAAQKALEEGFNAYDAVMNGVAAGMERVGALYDSQEYFVPELLLAADALYAGLDVLKPHIRMEDLSDKVKGQVVIGTV